MDFKRIPVSAHPSYVWLWNGTITKEGIRAQLDEMYDAGIRAVYVIGESENFRPLTRRTHLSPAYLSEEYIDLVYYAFTYAEEKGMYTWLYNEGGFPSGMACGIIRKERPDLAQKQLRSVTVTLPANTPYTPDAAHLAAFIGEERVHAGDTFDTEVEITCYVVGVTDGANMVQTDNAKLENTELFLKYTHEALKKRFGEHMGKEVTLMFDDEALMGTWTDGMETMFRDRYGYDPTDYLPVISKAVVPHTDAQFRAYSDYNLLGGELVLNNYFIPMRKWLNDNGMKSVGHVDLDSKTEGPGLRRYGNVMQILRAYDIPGVDVIWSQITYPTNGKSCKDGNEFFPRLASSAARQQGHSLSLSESCSVYGAHVTPEEMRYVVNYQAVRGISLYNFLAISYTRDGILPYQFRPSFIKENPGTDCLSEINEYIARLSHILQSSHAEIHTALYYPLRTICAGGALCAEAKASYEQLGEQLEAAGIDFDIIDEDFVQSASLDGGALVGEHVRYENVFVPIAGMEPPAVIEKMSRTGKAKMPCIGRTNPKLLARKLILPGGDEAYFITNTDGITIEDTVTIPSAKALYTVDLSDGEVYIPAYTQANGEIRLPVHLTRGEGMMLYLTDAPIQAKPVPMLSPVCGITDFTSFVSRRYTIQNGPHNEFFTDGEKSVGLAPWAENFSGEVTYTAALPTLPDGEYVLDLGEVHHIAKVYVDGEKIGEATMPPYRLSIPAHGREMKIVVANTAANVTRDDPFFAESDPADVGPYHGFMSKDEGKAPAGGLLGPVMIYKK